MELFNKYKSIESTSLGDTELLMKWREDTSAMAMAEIYKRYSHLVYGVCLKYLKSCAEAEDAVMEIFEHLMTHAPKSDIENFKVWLYVVSKNYCLQFLRKNNFDIQRNRQEELKNTTGFMELPHEIHLINEEEEWMRSDALKNALGKLSEEQRWCVELMYIERKSYHEISVITGFDENKVKSYIQNGKRNLRLILEEKL